MKKVIDWFKSLLEEPDPFYKGPEFFRDSEKLRKKELSECLTKQQTILEYVKTLTVDQREIFIKGMEYTANLDRMLRKMTTDEISAYHRDLIKDATKEPKVVA